MQRISSMIVSKPKDASADPFAADAPQAAILYREAGAFCHFFLFFRAAAKVQAESWGVVMVASCRGVLIFNKRPPFPFASPTTHPFPTTPLSPTLPHPSVANPSPLGLFAFGLTAILMAVRI